MTVPGSSLGVVAVALGLGALALAHDVHAWHDATARGDAPFRDAPGESGLGGRGGGSREASPRAYSGCATTASTACRAGVRGPRRPPGYRQRPPRGGARAAVQIALADVVAAGSPAQASRAGNLLGILTATSGEGADPTVDLQGANATFDAAVRADLANVDAKHNLELLLRGVQGRRHARGRGTAASQATTAPLAGAGAGPAGVGVLSGARGRLAAGAVGALACAPRARPARRARARVRPPAPRRARARARAGCRAGARLRAAALPVLACLLVGVAAARPVWMTTERQTARTSSEVVFVTDVSQSMLASPRAGAPTRLDRTRSVVRQMRAAVPDVPAGVAGLTDRALPYLFPTLDAGAFDDTVRRSVLPDAPQPQGIADVTSNFVPVAQLARNGFYSPEARHRTCVLVTDGETRSVLPAPRGCTLIVVRVGGSGDRIFGRNGRVDAEYRPEGSAASTARPPRAGRAEASRTPSGTSAPRRPHCRRRRRSALGRGSGQGRPCTRSRRTSRRWP